MTLPASENNIISLEPSVISTPTKRSLSSKSIAIIPELRGRENAGNGTFFTVPYLVAMNTNLPSSYSRTGNIALIDSFSAKGKILIIGLPREILLASGNS